MKSFMKSHRKSGSNPVEQDMKPPATPKLNHSASAFNLRQRTPTSSPTLYNSSAFTTSPLPPPPPVPFSYKPVSPVSSSSPVHSSDQTNNNSKRSILKGLLKHKSSKSSLNASASNPSSPIVASKSFVTFSDSSLTLPSQTPEFVVDRPNVSYLNIIDEEKHSTRQKMSQINDSPNSNLMDASKNDLSLESDAKVQTIEPSNEFVRAQLSILDSMDSNSINKSQYSFQSSGVGNDAAEIKESDNHSQHSSESSEFSFEANRTYGRSTSIKYYKKQEELEKEAAHAFERRFIDEFIGEDVDVTELHDDLNYDDSDAEDDTENLFQRKLFSSDEEDAVETNTMEENIDYDSDEYLDEVNDGLSDYEAIGGEVTEYKLEDEESIVTSSDRSEEGQTVEPTQSQQTSTEETTAAESSVISQVKTGSDIGSSSRVEQNTQSVPEAPKDHHSLFVNSMTKRMSQMTVDNSPSYSNEVINMGSTQRNRLGLNVRTNSVKFHQISGKHDDDLKFLNSRYSWYVNDEDAARIQQNLRKMEREAQLISDSIAMPSSEDIDSQYWGIPTSTSDIFDDSLLDEVNQMPEDFQFGSPELDPMRKLSNSTKNKHSKMSKLMAPSATTGTKFQQKDKTVTLFRSSSSRSKTVSFESIDSLEEDLGSAKYVDQSDEDDFSFITPVGSLNGQPNAAFNAENSPLTTISEGSYDSNSSPRA